ncbi:MAG: arginine decarboxylase, pyruvoyl-dependent [Clostridia bacterium]|nr:arginine decarboxylase, pyruvoyl-dependent [Clostridia bacterium]
MLPTPKKYFLTTGSGEGDSELTAFDAALLDAGIGNINLLKVSSILPPNAQYSPGLELPFGAIVPTAFGMIISEKPGQIISAAVAVGISENSFGIIMERTDLCTKEEIESKIEKMVQEAFVKRKMELKEIKISAVEHRVEKIGCCVAAVPLWY